MAMANNKKHVSGTFVGDGTNTVSIQIPFKPDVIVIASGREYTTAGWAGVGDIVMVRRKVSLCVRHANTSTTSYTTNAYPIYDNDSEYGTKEMAAQYTFFGNYNNGVMTIENVVLGTGTVFTNNQQYTWDAYVN